MVRVSRRQLARYVAKALSDGKDVIPELAAYLVESRRTKEVDLLVHDIEKMLEEHGTVVARVASAYELDSKEVADIQRALSQRYNAKEVVFVPRVETSLLGGIVVRTANDEFDGSLRRSINRLKALKV